MQRGREGERESLNLQLTSALSGDGSALVKNTSADLQIQLLASLDSKGKPSGNARIHLGTATPPRTL